jgi:hypothetical protein
LKKDKLTRSGCLVYLNRIFTLTYHFPSGNPDSAEFYSSIVLLDYLPPERADIFSELPIPMTTFYNGLQGSTLSRHSRAGFVYLPV